MPLAKQYGLIHAIAEHNGVNCIWADEEEGNQAATMEQARNIIRGNFLV